MYQPMSVKMHIVPGKQTGTLAANVRVETAEGIVYDEQDDVPLAAGNTITYGPLHAKVEVTSELGNVKTPPPGAASIADPHLAGKVGARPTR